MSLTRRSNLYSFRYVLLANTYEANGKQLKSKEIWNDMKKRKIKKIPGTTWITINGKTEVFTVDAQHKYPYFLFYICIF
jgi:hypothetical protein